MIIGIDIDDTLTYLHDIKIKTAQEYIKRNGLPYKLVRPSEHYFSEMFDWPREVCDKFWGEEIDALLASVDARPYASEVIKGFKERGHKIIIVTARDPRWHKDPYKLSYDWLKKNNICYDELLIGHTEKAQVCVDKNIDIFIDDTATVLNQIQEVGIDTIMIQTPHNKTQNIYSGKVVSDWREIAEIIEEKEKQTDREM